MASSEEGDAPRVVSTDNGSFTLPMVGRITIPRFPGQSALEAGMDIIDTKIPRIRGRPALREITANLKPGVTVSLVSLPLSISLAIASGATPVQGIITAVWAGFVSALMGGSHYNVVGPTGALSGILSYFSVTYGPRIQPLLAVVTGVFCLLVWASGIDKYLVFIPSAVMHGFTMGVAFIISANQINFALGLPKLKRHPEFVANLAESLSNAGKASIVAILIFAVSLGALLVLSKRYGKIPWAVVLAMIGIIIGSAADASKTTSIQTIKTQYGDLELSLIMVSDIFVDGLNAGMDVWMDLFRGSLSICAVAVLETLISARIADRMTKTIFNQKQEVLSVGLANLASGATGGLPATAALARTALNIKSGATSRASGIVNALSIMILSTALFSQFKFLPLPIVAAILCNTAYRMLEVEEIKLLAKSDPPMMAVAIVTMLICIIEDPTMGILYGTFLAMIRSLMAMLHGHAVLSVFKGTRCELLHIFTLNDHTGQLKKVRKSFTGEMDKEEAAKLKKLADAEKAAASTVLAEATMTIKKAREKAKAEVAQSLKAQLSSAEAFQLDKGTNAAGHFTAVNESDVDEHVPRVAVYSVAGYFTYISASSHLARLRGLFLDEHTRLPGVEVVAISLEDCYYSDPDAMDAVGDLIQELIRHKKTVFLLGFQPAVERMVHMQHWAHGIVCFPDYGALLVHVREVAQLELEKAVAGHPADLRDYVQQRLQAGAGAGGLGLGATASFMPGGLQRKGSGVLGLGLGLGLAGTPSGSGSTPQPQGDASESTGNPLLMTGSMPLPASNANTPAQPAVSFTPRSAGYGQPLTHPVMSNGLSTPAPAAAPSGAAGAGALKAADDW